MSVVNKSALHLWTYMVGQKAQESCLNLRSEPEGTRKLLRWKISAKATSIFFTISGRNSDDAVLAALRAFPFQTMKHSSYKTTDCTSVLFTIILHVSEITWKCSSAQIKTKAIINSLTVAPAAIKNIIHVFTHNTVSCCGVARDASKDNAVEVLPVAIQYFDGKMVVYSQS